MSLWVVRLGTRSAASLCSSNSRRPPDIGRLGLLLATVTLMPSAMLSQLTTGSIEGTLRATDGRPVAGAPILVTGGAGVRIVIHSNSNGEFTMTLPYGQYRLSGAAQLHPASSLVTPFFVTPFFVTPFFVTPLQTTRLDLVIDASGSIRGAQPDARTPGMWTDGRAGRLYPEAFSLPGVLLSREPSTVTQPLDFAGLSDTRLAVESQRGFSWTDTQYKLHGMDATDSYQPGLPAIAPDVQALEEGVVRSAFAQTASSSDGTEIGLFLIAPSGSPSRLASWHGAVSSANTGAALSSTNLPAPANRGLVQQTDEFRWFTRDSAEIGGPITRRADFHAAGTGQWASQTEPLAAPGTDQRSRMLFGNARGRVRASDRDQFDALY